VNAYHHVRDIGLLDGTAAESSSGPADATKREAVDRAPDRAPRADVRRLSDQPKICVCRIMYFAYGTAEVPSKSEHVAVIVVRRRLTPEKKNVKVPDHEPSG
jgi:hypothetical protein